MRGENSLERKDRERRGERLKVPFSACYQITGSQAGLVCVCVCVYVSVCVRAEYCTLFRAAPLSSLTQQALGASALWSLYQLVRSQPL